MYIYARAVEAATPTVLVVWPGAWLKDMAGDFTVTLYKNKD
jgi:hypothetical protein